jgi:hypothetical protein
MVNYGSRCWKTIPGLYKDQSNSARVFAAPAWSLAQRNSLTGLMYAWLRAVAAFYEPELDAAERDVEK